MKQIFKNGSEVWCEGRSTLTGPTKWYGEKSDENGAPATRLSLEIFSVRWLSLFFLSTALFRSKDFFEFGKSLSLPSVTVMPYKLQFYVCARWQISLFKLGLIYHNIRYLTLNLFFFFTIILWMLRGFRCTFTATPDSNAVYWFCVNLCTITC